MVRPTLPSGRVCGASMSVTPSRRNSCSRMQRSLPVSQFSSRPMPVARCRPTQRSTSWHGAWHPPMTCHSPRRAFRLPNASRRHPDCHSREGGNPPTWNGLDARLRGQDESGDKYWMPANEQRIQRLDSTRSRRYTTKVISKRGGTTVSENDQKTNTSRRSSLTHLLHNQSVAQAAVLIAVATFLSKFVGFAREVVIARQFGATGQTDAFLIGMMVPSLVLGLFAGGLGILIVPWYLGHKREDPERARLLVDQVTLVWGIVFALVCVGVWAFAPQLVHIFASGFEGARYTLAVQVTRLLVPMGFMLIMTGLFTGLLQAESSFLVALLWTLVGNVALVACLLAFSSRMGIRAWTLGQTAMAVIDFVPLVILLASKRYGFLKRFDVRHMDWPAILQFAALLMPLVLGGGVAALNVMVDRWVASRLPEGAIAALDFAGRVWTIPITLLASPIAIAVFPSFSSMAVDGSALHAMDDKVRRTVAFLAYIVIPSSVGIVILATPITRLLFQRGAFDATATAITASCVQMYALGLVFQAIAPILAKVFYAFKNTVTPLLIGLGIVGANMAGNIILSRYLGAAGIALATTITIMLGTAIYALLLRRYFRTENRATPTYPLWTQMLRTLLATVPVGLIAWLGLRWISPITAFIPLLVRAMAVCIVAALAYAGCSIALHLDGWQTIQGRFTGLAHRLQGR
ncbi:murein biosynthesis integral membrane protein MurJ [Candidatus Cryosericum septentrionale]|uniref:Probable lipid II flippase MurJ n=2 Tax=Candidatus Cryosericum septentrionale TaxID=2290913 RepID=A0A398DVI7_9BACT|nr:murein biosynthesis integral membrane protein MurJ [Candidatus Cryosericum septentrionale]